MSRRVQRTIALEIGHTINWVRNSILDSAFDLCKIFCKKNTVFRKMTSAFYQTHCNYRPTCWIIFSVSPPIVSLRNPEATIFNARPKFLAIELQGVRRCWRDTSHCSPHADCSRLPSALNQRAITMDRRQPDRSSSQRLHWETRHRGPDIKRKRVSRLWLCYLRPDVLPNWNRRFRAIFWTQQSPLGIVIQLSLP